MHTSILALFTLAATACHAQVSSVIVSSIIAPTTSIVTYKTIRCSTYYALTSVAKISRNTVDVTSRIHETIYPYVYSNVTSSVSTCYQQYPTAVAANVNAAVASYPAEVLCTKTVEIVKIAYVTSPTTTYPRTILSYPTANPQGFQYAVYANNQGADTDATYSQFNPAVFQNSTPWYHSTSNAIGGLSGTYSASSGFVKFYGSSVAFNQSNFVINHRWYLAAPQTGTYTVTIPAADDIALLWTGIPAYENWNRTNAVQTVTYGNITHTTYSFAATAGVYLPMRVVYAQAAGAYAFSLTLTAPDGTVLLGQNTAGSAAIIQYSCSGFEGPAPPFLEFGEENLYDDEIVTVT